MTSPAAPAPEGDVTSVTAGAEYERDLRRADFTRCFQAAYPRLVGQLQAITGDATVAHEAVQEAFARSWPRWGVVRRLDDPVGWLRRLALRLARRRRPVRSGERWGLDEHASAPHTMDPENLLVLDALGRLPAPERRALVLHHMAALSVTAIAEEEGVSEATAAARLARGRAVLADLLSDDGTPVDLFEGSQT